MILRCVSEEYIYSMMVVVVVVMVVVVVVVVVVRDVGCRLWLVCLVSTER